MKLNNWESLIGYNLSVPQKLSRTPEPSSVTDHQDSVNDYNKVMETNMTVNYSVILDIIYRARQGKFLDKALDLCAGPGHLTTCIAKYLNYKSATGVDLSSPMIDIANKNAKSQGLANRLCFHRADVLSLKDFKRGEFDLVSFTNSAHHFANIYDVENVLANAETLVNRDGLVVLFDLARLKDHAATDAFVQLAGEDFKVRQMNSMFEDFKNSMYAAWLPDELSQAVPKSSDRNWFHIIPRTLTSFQAIVGVPRTQSEIFLRDSFAWETTGIHQSEDAKNGWLFYRQLLAEAEIRAYAQKKLKAS